MLRFDGLAARIGCVEVVESLGSCNLSAIDRNRFVFRQTKFFDLNQYLHTFSDSNLLTRINDTHTNELMFQATFKYSGLYCNY
jgi:hypothetical protein